MRIGLNSECSAGGNDYLLVEVIDFDDDISGVYGDAEINWPGQTPFTIPVEFENGSAMIDLYTNQPIENGDLTINISVTGAANGGKNTESLQTPIFCLALQTFSQSSYAKNGSEIEQLMFGQTADAVIRIRSSRPISEASATIEQIGWTASAPPQDDADVGLILQTKQTNLVSEYNLIRRLFQEMESWGLGSWTSTKLFHFLLRF